VSWYLEALKKYSDFSGRARRKEYWLFTLFSLLIILVLILIENATGMTRTGYDLLSGLYSLAVLIPSLAVTVRRLHDTSHSGWWLLIGLIPLVGSIVLLIFMVRDSDPGENLYGPNPKQSAPVPV
jgi:uncharacterized membrane protein YhaH (DUF805 family)